MGVVPSLSIEEGGKQKHTRKLRKETVKTILQASSLRARLFFLTQCVPVCLIV